MQVAQGAIILWLHCNLTNELFSTCKKDATRGSIKTMVYCAEKHINLSNTYFAAIYQSHVELGWNATERLQIEEDRERPIFQKVMIYNRNKRSTHLISSMHTVHWLCKWFCHHTTQACGVEVNMGSNDLVRNVANCPSFHKAIKWKVMTWLWQLRKIGARGKKYHI